MNMSSLWSSQKCRVKSCCCGCSLRDGSLGIGWVSLIYNACDAVFLTIDQVISPYGGWWFLWVSVVVRVIHSVMSILLLHGIYKEKTQFIKKFIYVSMAVLVYELVNCIVMVVELSSITGHPNFWGMFLYMLTGDLFQIGLYTYFIIVLRSLAISVDERIQDLGNGML